jgi:putative heme-binding domain-containing protein
VWPRGVALAAMMRWVSSVSLAVAAVAALSAQHNFTPAEVENGGRLYQSTCAGCHGTAGDQVAGTALRGGKFRRASTDDEVVRIIRNGITGTGMAPQAVSETEAAMIVAWLRGSSVASASPALPNRLAGDPARGRVLFEGKGRCTSCHGPGGVGSRRAPGLTDIGVIRRPLQIEQALLDPAAEIHTDFRAITATMTDGTTVTGRLLNQNSYSIQLLDSTDRLRSLDKAQVRSYNILTTSPMPSYRQSLSAQEVTDVVAFLGTMKGTR